MDFQFFYDHRDEILKLLDTQYKWNLIDILLKENFHFANINDLHNLVWNQAQITFFHLSVCHIMITYGNIALIAIRLFTNIEPEHLAYLNNDQEVRLTDIAIVEIGIQFTNILYKTPYYHQLFNTYLTNYILEQIHAGNVTEEFLQYLFSLLT